MNEQTERLLSLIDKLAAFLAEAHAEDKAADHYGDETCSYCEAIDEANEVLRQHGRRRL